MNHCIPYTYICLQCMNIALKWGFIYWNCASLIVNSGSTNDDSEEGTNYGKISKAMGSMAKEGIKISLPSVNRSKFGFYPDASRNEIVYGLKPIQGVGTKIAKAIIDKRPYSSMMDFYNKMQDFKSEADENKFGDTTMIILIKAGCFDELENRPRQEIMRDFIRSISNPIKSLKIGNIEDLNELGLLTDTQKKYELRLYKYRKYVCQKKFFVKSTGKSPTTAYYKLERKFAEPAFYDWFETYMTEGKDYEYSNDGFICVKKGSLDRVFDKLTEDFKKNVLGNEKFLDKINEQKFQKIWNEKASGTLAKWEMDSLCFYYTEHELANVSRKEYNIVNFDELNPQSQIADYFYYRGQVKPRFALYRICGTVLDRDKNKHTVTILTPDGVVAVKFYSGAFTYYDKQISRLNEDGTKTKIESSWFSRGNKLLITGYRRDDQFVPRQYKDSIYKHTVQLIKLVNDDGTLILQSERAGTESEEC